MLTTESRLSWLSLCTSKRASAVEYSVCANSNMWVGHKEESNAVLRGSLMMATEKQRNRERNRKYDGHFGLNSVSVCAVTEESRQDRTARVQL